MRTGSVRKVSTFHDTSPVGPIEQPRFLNAVAELDTELTPQALLAALLNIERALGRDRKNSVPKGPRTIDLDLLLYDAVVLDTPELTVPHPAMHERAFVLEPLVEIAPDAFHPVFMRSARDLLRAMGPSQRA
jgi:2-amino-4-hydroxy-6-hydroxymethyldihydropteridine diphosphokinase